MNASFPDAPSRRNLLAGAAASCFTGAFVSSAKSASAMNHIALLGDSIFDNAAYVGSGPDVVRQLRAILPQGWRATLNAVDGATIEDIRAQLARVPDDASHLVVSIGGNDALLEARVIEESARSMGAALDRLAGVRDRFQTNYRAMLEGVRSRMLPSAICTIYDARFPEPDMRRRAAVALAILNDCITREIFSHDLTLIDLRLVCDSDAAFANPIEPSVTGGAKIAQAIASFAAGTSSRSSVIAR
jgi:lysophospholipase L1-like esterase